jgi:hypothetical protein
MGSSYSAASFLQRVASYQNHGLLEGKAYIKAYKETNKEEKQLLLSEYKYGAFLRASEKNCLTEELAYSLIDGTTLPYQRYKIISLIADIIPRRFLHSFLLDDLENIQKYNPYFLTAYNITLMIIHMKTVLPHMLKLLECTPQESLTFDFFYSYFISFYAYINKRRMSMENIGETTEMFVKTLSHVPRQHWKGLRPLIKLIKKVTCVKLLSAQNIG